MRSSLLSFLLVSIGVCGGGGCGSASIAAPAENAHVPPAVAATSSTRSTAQPAESPLPFTATPIARFDHPWAFAFIPGTKSALVTEQQGALKHWTEGGPIRDVAGVPKVDHGGQGGVGDVALAPDFATSRMIYLSWVEPGDGGTRGAALGRAKLVDDAQGLRLENLRIVWRQTPKTTGRGHFSHRIAFSPDGKYLFLTSGDRQKLAPAQDLSNNLGATLRLFPDGSVPPDNPFADRKDAGAQIWSYGHRNLLGIAFDANGQLWTSEMGPRGGDELNREVEGANYGWPVVSNGDHYDGSNIPDHPTRPEFNAPATWWNPVISPAGLMFVRGDRYAGWQGDALLPGLSSRALVRVTFGAGGAREVARYPMGARIRAVAEREDGTVWLLEDSDRGRLIRLAPRD
ncbi:MAG: PQQ-dependent sugar dehydrogenase [Burkholderiales bacterium]